LIITRKAFKRYYKYFIIFFSVLNFNKTVISNLITGIRIISIKQGWRVLFDVILVKKTQTGEMKRYNLFYLIGEWPEWIIENNILNLKIIKAHIILP